MKAPLWRRIRRFFTLHVFGLVYPEDWGAVGDGITDDQPALQSAADALAGGGTLVLGKKTYRLSSALNTDGKGESK